MLSEIAVLAVSILYKLLYNHVPDSSKRYTEYFFPSIGPSVDLLAHIGWNMIPFVVVVSFAHIYLEMNGSGYGIVFSIRP